MCETHPILSCLGLSASVLSGSFWPCPILSGPIHFCPVLSHPNLSGPILSSSVHFCPLCFCPVLSWLVLSGRVLSSPSCLALLYSILVYHHGRHSREFVNARYLGRTFHKLLLIFTMVPQGRNYHQFTRKETGARRRLWNLSSWWTWKGANLRLYLTHYIRIPNTHPPCAGRAFEKLCFLFHGAWEASGGMLLWLHTHAPHPWGPRHLATVPHKMRWFSHQRFGKGDPLALPSMWLSPSQLIQPPGHSVSRVPVSPWAGWSLTQSDGAHMLLVSPQVGHKTLLLTHVGRGLAGADLSCPLAQSCP